MDKNKVLRLAKLAKIYFSNQQIDTVISQFKPIIKMIDELQHIDCKDIEPLQSISRYELVTRADEINDGNLQEELFYNAPGKNADLAKQIKCFVVPKVIE
jgi:aspartyl-tRNA(Asn)/glutamyl-tRNA(Gln) amidotransferase subunit C